MTVLSHYKDIDEHLEELLVKNLPSTINGGNEKFNSNIFKLATIKALKSCNFIHFNTTERISLMIFDFDTYNDKEAIETFKDIYMFNEYIVSFLGMDPTYITQTTKGYQFAYHLKNHIYTHQKKAFNYLYNIKKGIIEKLGCDTHGSIRNVGIWRNPLKHNHYYSQQLNYELSDFKEFAIPKKTYQQKSERVIKVKKINTSELVEGNRNDMIFKASMRWAKYQKGLTKEDIYTYSSKYNNQAEEPLEANEIYQIATSVYYYYSNDLITISTGKEERNINEGVMKFEKISGLSKIEYVNEVKNRQQLSAQRTNELIGKNQKKELMLKAKNIHIENQKKTNVEKIKKSMEELIQSGLKINNSSIARLAGLDRKTVRKYLK